MNAAQSGGHTSSSSMSKKGSQMEELVAISPERRNWRGIFIALLVIALVCSLIIFSIFLLSPEDESLRIRGRHMVLSDILGKSLHWKPFNGTWSNDVELIFRDPTGGLSILNLDNYTTRVLMTNSTFRQLNAESFLVSPDLKYVLLQSDSNAEGSRHHLYEVETENTFPLGPTENIAEAPRLQYVMWAPCSPPPAAASSSTAAIMPSSSATPTANIITSTMTTTTTTTTTTTMPTTQSSTSANTSSVSATNDVDDLIVMGMADKLIAVENDQIEETNQHTTTTTTIAATNSIFVDRIDNCGSSQAVAFVYENDIYYKPKVQAETVYRITRTGNAGIIYNGIPDWTYANVPELNSRHNCMAFSSDGLYLAFLTFNDTEVNEYKYTWMGDDMKYPTVHTQRYPKAGDTNPRVTVNVVNLSVLRQNNIFPQPVRLPVELAHDCYIGALTWATRTDLSVTVTNRVQTKATTVICQSPEFHCQSLHTEITSNDGWVLPIEKPIFSAHLGVHDKQQQQQQQQQQKSNNSPPRGNMRNSNSRMNEFFQNVTNGQTTYEITNGGYLLKRLPVRDGEHGHFRHVVLISTHDHRPVPLTMGRFEVTEIVGWDEINEIVYFMAAPEKRPGERHLYKISLKLNVNKPNRTYITSSQPTCLTCDNTASTFKLLDLTARKPPNVHSSPSVPHYIPRNCLYNKIYFSRNYSHYVQECLGPESPSVYLVETRRNMKISILNAGDSLRHRLTQLAVPQIRTFSVEIRNGFHAQVRLFLPPGMREEEEVVFPLILHIDAAPGSQLVTSKYHVDWNWYLSSQRSMVVAQIDGRGSGFQGELLRMQMHAKLGTVEVEDQLGVLTYLRENLKFIDPTRICVYGWGYGGYASAMTLIDDSQEVIKCAVAINPIVSFGYHYSFFTERYIPLRGDYLRALQEADLAMKAGNINERNLMLIHGTADTLVHQEQTLMLVRALVDQEVKFRHQVYPDDDHMMTKSLSHVYKTMEWYFDECFGPNDDSEWDPTGLFGFKQ